jgi:hypothetical protein
MLRQLCWEGLQQRVELKVLWSRLQQHSFEVQLQVGCCIVKLMLHTSDRCGDDYCHDHEGDDYDCEL